MPSLEILKPGLLTSIQDIGRQGLSFFAIPRAGVLDQNAAQIALLLLNLPMDHPLIECTSIAPHIQFNDAARIAISGADFNWKLNDAAVHPNQVLHVNEGDILRGQFAKQGLRGYIAIDGALRINKMYNSFATYLPAKMGGYQGRTLQKGDILEWEEQPAPQDGIVSISVLPGPEFNWLSNAAKDELREVVYVVSADSNRMGLRLKGTTLTASSYQLQNSAPVLPGFIQLPPSGQPIIVLQSGQTTGGYPRILYLRPNDLPMLNQIPLGGKLRLNLM